MVSLPRDVLEQMLKDAAKAGAREALAEVGLGDEKAPKDIRNLRDLLAGYKAIKFGALRELGKWLAIILIGLVIYKLGWKPQ